MVLFLFQPESLENLEEGRLKEQVEEIGQQKNENVGKNKLATYLNQSQADRISPSTQKEKEVQKLNGDQRGGESGDRLENF